ncbi:MAG TPA: hypothetical protein VG838_07935 [Opitutaceae bacterium]|nr:hypothetical protein [Opitutaceae bacterium]
MTRPFHLPSFPSVVLGAIVFLGLQTAAWADAPVSLAGKVYHDVLMPSSQTSSAIIVRLNADGSYNWIKQAQGSAPSYILYLLTPPPDGTYSYLRTSATTGVLSLSGTTTSRTLIFATATNGGVDSGVGYGTFELTDNPESSTAPLLNCSMLGRVGPGQSLTAGFIVSGTIKREFLIRVVGPSLTRFGVSGVWADPDFNTYTTVADTSPFSFPNGHYGDWSVAPDPSLPPVAGLAKIFATVGAFPLDPGSKDAVQLIKLSPGAYTVVATTKNSADPGGAVLIEIYALP